MRRYLTEEEIAKQSAETTRVEMEKLNKILQENSEKILRKKINKKKIDDDSDYSPSESELDSESDEIGSSVLKEYYTRSKKNKPARDYEKELEELEKKHHYTILDLSNAKVELETCKNKLKLMEDDTKIIEKWLELLSYTTLLSSENYIHYSIESAESEKDKRIKYIDLVDKIHNYAEYDINEISKINNKRIKQFIFNEANKKKPILNDMLDNLYKISPFRPFACCRNTPLSFLTILLLIVAILTMIFSMYQYYYGSL
jgi:hypothetical protein